MSEMISILSVEDKLSKNNKKFFAVSTDKGKMSAWDQIVADHLKANVGKVCEVEVELKGTFKNITKFIRATEKKASEPVNTSQGQDRMAERLKIDAGNRTREACDLTIAWMTQNKCTVKEAIEVFKNFTEASASNFRKAELELVIAEVTAEKTPSKGESPAQDFLQAGGLTYEEARLLGEFD